MNNSQTTHLTDWKTYTDIGYTDSLLMLSKVISQ